jgi:hypothetical protein
MYRLFKYFRYMQLSDWMYHLELFIAYYKGKGAVRRPVPNSKGMMQRQEIVAPSGRGTRVLMGSGYVGKTMFVKYYVNRNDIS